MPNYEAENYHGRERLKTLVVFPDAAKGIAKRRLDLGLPPIEVKELEYGIDEVAEVTNRLEGKLLAPKKATLGGLLDVLEEGWDIIWLITHGEDAGWYLTDGLVNASEMTSMIRASGVWLTVMNTCSSREVAEKAAEELGTAFIATITEVPDRQAFITGVLFTQKLAAGYDYVEAWKLAKPGQSHPFILIEARANMPPPLERNTPQRSPSSIDAITFDKFIASVQELDLIINGSDRLGVPGIKGAVKEIKDELKVIRVQLDAIQRKQQIRNWIMGGMMVLILGLIVALVVISNALGGPV